MGKQPGLLERATANPHGLSFRDFETLLKSCGWIYKRQSGSHRLWASPTGFRLPIQNLGGKAKAYQVRQFLKQREHEVKHGTK
jgi:predicted RNA binding protein YcfA (HicA-like mRNA interferase family)